MTRSRAMWIAASAAIGAVAGALLVRRATPAPPVGSWGRFLASPMVLSLAMWLALSLYWEWAARNASATRSAESRASRTLHLVLITAAQVLSFWPFAGWPKAAGPRFAFPRVLPDSPLWVPLGLALEAFGL